MESHSFMHYSFAFKCRMNHLITVKCLSFMQKLFIDNIDTIHHNIKIEQCFENYIDYKSSWLNYLELHRLFENHKIQWQTFKIQKKSKKMHVDYFLGDQLGYKNFFLTNFLSYYLLFWELAKVWYFRIYLSCCRPLKNSLVLNRLK